MNVGLLGTCVLLVVVQFLMAVPWASAIGIIPRGTARTRNFWLVGLGSAAAVGVLLGLFLNANNDSKILANWGRFFFSLFHLQVGMDFFYVAFLGMLRFWPKGGAVALASFQEGLRQPKYW